MRRRSGKTKPRGSRLAPSRAHPTEPPKRPRNLLAGDCLSSKEERILSLAERSDHAAIGAKHLAIDPGAVGTRSFGSSPSKARYISLTNLIGGESWSPGGNERQPKSTGPGWDESRAHLLWRHFSVVKPFFTPFERTFGP